MEQDILFLHPPSSFTKLEHPLGGVFAAQTGTSDFFVGMPVGLVNMAHQLLKGGFKSRVVNIADYVRTHGTRFDVARFVDSTDARAYGIDLHWAVHTPGALDLAALVKRRRGDAFVFLGGLTASYFCEEILNSYPFVDGVMVGECDDAIVLLARELQKPAFDATRVPNLVHRLNGAVVRNRVLLPELEDFNFYNYYSIVEPTPLVSRHLMLPVIRGCRQNCPFCGGSQYSYRTHFARPRLSALSPEKLAWNIQQFVRRGGEAVNLLGDIRCGGGAYADDVIARIKRFSHRISIKNELFWPAEQAYLKKWADHAEVLDLVLSPESADPPVMQALGKTYSPDAILEQARWCNELNIDLTLSFLYALPYQTRDSLMRTMDFIERALKLPGSRTGFMIEPMLFVDPGSMIFEQPEKWGYRIDFRTLADIDSHLRHSHWSFAVGYETDWMSKDALVDAIFEVSERAAGLYHADAEISAEDYQKTLQTIRLNRKIIEERRANPELASAEVADLIRKTFPPHLLDDNNLIKYSQHSDEGL